MFLVKNTVLENSLGPMEVHITVTSKKIIFKEMESIIGLMEEFLKGLGTTIKWRDREYSPGLMAEDMRVITKMIRKKATVFSTGQMVGSTMEAGKMENNMVWVHTHQPVENQNKVNGKKEKDSTGFQVMEL